MITKGEINLMLQMYKNKGRVTAKDQEVFSNPNYFYRAVGRLKTINMISDYIVTLDFVDKRVKVYELTYRGLMFIKILLGEEIER